MATPPEQARTDRGVTGAQIALIVLGLVILLGVLWFVFLRGEPTVDTAPPPPPEAAPVATPEPEATTQPGKRPVETFEVFAPKDPFRPAIVAAINGGGTAPAPGATPGPGGTNGSGNGGPSEGASGGNGGNGGNGSDSVGGHRVRLVDVFTQGGEQRARVQVDGTVYTVEEGDRFADNFELLSIEGQCASLLFGDDQFTLCEGEEILK